MSEIKKVAPTMQIIMVTVYEDSERIFRALKAGANGYLVKSSPPEQLLAAIRDVYKGGAAMSSHIASKVVKHFHMVGNSPREAENLSPREGEVLELLALGFIYKEIGDKLNIGTETVRTYVKNIARKCTCGADSKPLPNTGQNIIDAGRFPTRASACPVGELPYQHSIAPLQTNRQQAFMSSAVTIHRSGFAF